MDNINNYHNLKRFKDATPASFIIEKAVVNKMQLVKVRNFYADYFKELIRSRIETKQEIYFINEYSVTPQGCINKLELKRLERDSKYYKHLAIMIGQLRDGLTHLLQFFPKKEMKMNVRISWRNNRVDIEPVKSYTDEMVWKAYSQNCHYM